MSSLKNQIRKPSHRPAYASKPLLLFVFPRSQFADPLGHSPHRAKCTPGSGLIQSHDHKSKKQRSQHQAVKPKAVLGHPVRHRPRRVGPSPGNPECPEQFDGLPKAPRPRSHQIRLKDHIAEHGQKEQKEPIAEPCGVHPLWRRFISRAFHLAAKFRVQLPPAAEAVAEPFISPKNGQTQGKKKIDHPQPRKQDIKKSQGEIHDLVDPQIIIPLLFHPLLPFLSPKYSRPDRSRHICRTLRTDLYPRSRNTPLPP